MGQPSWFNINNDAAWTNTGRVNLYMSVPKAQKMRFSNYSGSNWSNTGNYYAVYT